MYHKLEGAVNMPFCTNLFVYVFLTVFWWLLKEAIHYLVLAVDGGLIFCFARCSGYCFTGGVSSVHFLIGNKLHLERRYSIRILEGFRRLPQNGIVVNVDPTHRVICGLLNVDSLVRTLGT
ncbi:hypothetical protein PanWU01x14_004000 [Parasponia andersonii]|uniref:Uncharacterized protein n=1 Tax=Parasponia andersonii TaxID=3476 RepID=A0A2P5E356_PARAD|nr:hypothetical protein PanWU01x14_004000 [Parasponia andersonii]